MHITLSRCKKSLLLLALDRNLVGGQTWSPIVVKNITNLGSQSAPDVTVVSRDGGYSCLIEGRIVWLYDDTECLDLDGHQHSFVSNTASYAYQHDRNISTVTDFGVVGAGVDGQGRKVHAILADTAVGSGGWIPFQHDELEFNKRKIGQERVAIWPGTSPTSISITQAFLYAPLVYVDFKPQDPSKEYQARGMILITIKAPSSGPVATRHGDLVIPGTEVAYGGFSTLLGVPTTNGSEVIDPNRRDLYLLGVTRHGLQLARVSLDDINAYDKYTFFHPKSREFLTTPPRLDVSESEEIYISGTFSSGNVFYSPYFGTFIIVYFNKMADSTFYIRHLSIQDPLSDSKFWTKGGKNGKGIDAEDAEALIRYAWSSEQKLYTSPSGKGGFNYAGMAHPEYFNRQYFAKSLYPDSTSDDDRRNDWFGSDFLPEEHAGSDGKHLLLSWTSQVQGKKEAALYEIRLAVVEFDDIPSRSSGGNEEVTSQPSVPQSTSVDQPDQRYDGLPQGYRGDSDALSSFLGDVTGKRFGVWDLFWKAMIWLGVVALGALVL